MTIAESRTTQLLQWTWEQYLCQFTTTLECIITNPRQLLSAQIQLLKFGVGERTISNGLQTVWKVDSR